MAKIWPKMARKYGQKYGQKIWPKNMTKNGQINGQKREKNACRHNTNFENFSAQRYPWSTKKTRCLR